MKQIALWCLPVLGFLLSNCSKEPLDNLTAEESRLYITNYDTSVRFNTYRTFTIADSIAVVENNRLVRKEQTAASIQFAASFANGLKERGFQQVTRDENPDLGIALSRITNTSTSLVSYTDYGYNYGGYWDPYFWDYPGYSYYFPTYYGTYQTSETVLSIDVFDLKNSGQNNQLRAVWSGVIRGGGIFTSGAAGQVAALLGQSAYLKTQ